ncbi:uncharacterized protein RAG0_16873 [Rhynchosporium agropyri]|uniref:Antifungal protein n=1 Tax=Rhynchosporium agropyri TaxID=914238 RepID=A0A1E1LSB9_9HELO|nr:uncharacterized protein RAG0_16873 [Rhynchosporium agropyri]
MRFNNMSIVALGFSAFTLIEADFLRDRAQCRANPECLTGNCGYDKSSTTGRRCLGNGDKVDQACNLTLERNTCSPPLQCAIDGDPEETNFGKCKPRR